MLLITPIYRLVQCLRLETLLTGQYYLTFFKGGIRVIARYFQVGLGLGTSIDTSLAFVSKGRMIGKKRGTTLDFTMKVIIFVCTLVKVYNMGKKIKLIVTVVSITSLYF